MTAFRNTPPPIKQSNHPLNSADWLPDSLFLHAAKLPEQMSDIRCLLFPPPTLWEPTTIWSPPPRLHGRNTYARLAHPVPPLPPALAATSGPNLPHLPHPVGTWNAERMTLWFTLNNSTPSARCLPTAAPLFSLHQFPCHFFLLSWARAPSSASRKALSFDEPVYSVIKMILCLYDALGKGCACVLQPHNCDSPKRV